jgi:hypothetical protein
VRVAFACPADALLVAARARGGSWHVAKAVGGKAEVEVPLRFGEQRVEVSAVSPTGIVGRAEVSVRCLAQPSPDDPAPPEPAADPGLVEIPGVGAVKVLVQPNVVTAAEGGAR